MFFFKNICKPYHAARTGAMFILILKSIVNSSNFSTSSILIKVKLYKNRVKFAAEFFLIMPPNIDAGVKIQLFPATIGLPTGGFFKFFR